MRKEAGNSTLPSPLKSAYSSLLHPAIRAVAPGYFLAETKVGSNSRYSVIQNAQKVIRPGILLVFRPLYAWPILSEYIRNGFYSIY